jgi:general secretion pathway protein K
MRRLNNPNNYRGDEQGAVLLLVSLILALISILILSWAREWRNELSLTANFLEVRKSRRLAEAGVYYALGKLAIARSAEIAARQNMGNLQPQLSDQETWPLDSRPHLLEFPGGQAEVEIADEGGKFNLNQVSEEILLRLLTLLGSKDLKTRIMVDSILDWRTKGDQPRLYGAKNSYYLRLDPPYVAKKGIFETVGELAWVRGFENSALIPRLTDLLTVQPTGGAINLNTAPRLVLEAAGFSPAVVETIITTRKQTPFRSQQDIAQLLSDPQMLQRQRLGFITSIFFTIKSKGMINNSKGPYTVKAIVRLLPNRPIPWDIISWMDDVSG